MNKDLTHLVFLVDRSGSMNSVADEMNEAINAIIVGQKEGVGDCLLSIYQFDSPNGWVSHSTPPSFRRSNVQIDIVCENINIREAPLFNIKPRGMTPLIDAGCLIIDKVGQILATQREEERPAKVIFVMVTDGLENMSSEFERKDLMNRIKIQRDVYKWTIMFVGAKQDAVAEAKKYGIDEKFSMTYAANRSGTKGMSDSLNNKFSRIRSMGNAAYCSNASTGEVSFDKEDRKIQEKAGVKNV